MKFLPHINGCYLLLSPNDKEYWDLAHTYENAIINNEKLTNAFFHIYIKYREEIFSVQSQIVLESVNLRKDIRLTHLHGHN